jgi:hypothetical protein
MNPVAARKGTGHLAPDGSRKPLAGLAGRLFPCGGRTEVRLAEGIAAVARSSVAGSFAMTVLFGGSPLGMH